MFVNLIAGANNRSERVASEEGSLSDHCSKESRSHGAEAKDSSTGAEKSVGTE